MPGAIGPWGLDTSPIPTLPNSSPLVAKVTSPEKEWCELQETSHRSEVNSSWSQGYTKDEIV